MTIIKIRIIMMIMIIQMVTYYDIFIIYQVQFFSTLFLVLKIINKKILTILLFNLGVRPQTYAFVKTKNAIYGWAYLRDFSIFFSDISQVLMVLFYIIHKEIFLLSIFYSFKDYVVFYSDGKFTQRNTALELTVSIH